MGPRSAAILANTPRNSQLLSLLPIYFTLIKSAIVCKLDRSVAAISSAQRLSSACKNSWLGTSFFVFEVMLDACSAIHRDGAKLNFDAHATAEFEAIIASLRFGPL